MKMKDIVLNENDKKADETNPFKAAYNSIVTKFDSPESITGLSTGFVDLDQWISGLHAGELVWVTGVPSAGKTVFASNIACHAACNQDKPVLYFTLEMSADRLAKRMITATGNLKCFDICSGIVRDDDWTRISKTIYMLHPKTGFYIVDSMASIEEMIVHARLLGESNKLGLVVIDYLQLAKELIEKSADISLIATHMARLKSLAHELDAPVMVISSNLQRMEGSGGHSHEISNVIPHVDVHLDIHQNEEVSINARSCTTTTIEIVRARNASVGKISLLFLREYLRFDNLIENLD